MTSSSPGDEQQENSETSTTDEPDDSLVSNLIEGMAHAANQAGHGYFHPTSLSIAILAEYLIERGWPASRPQDVVSHHVWDKPEPILTYPRPVLLGRSIPCKNGHHQGCKVACGCACHPFADRFEVPDHG